MALNVGELYATLDGDTSKFDKSIEAAARLIEKLDANFSAAASGIETGTSSASNAINAMGASAGAASSPVSSLVGAMSSFAAIQQSLIPILLRSAAAIPSLVTILGSLKQAWAANDAAMSAIKAGATTAQATTAKWSPILKGVAVSLVAVGGAAVAFKTVTSVAGKLTAALTGTKAAAAGTASSFASMHASFLLMNVGNQIVTGLWDAFKGVSVGAIAAGSAFEDSEAQLTTLLGSSTLAKERLDELYRIGASTPFELAGLVDAETKLVAFGDKTGELRTGMLNLAAGLGIDVADAADAVGRAFAGGAGAADILRERGVLAMIEMRTGIKATDMELGEFRDALKETLEQDFAGGVERASQTFTGLMSNLNDSWSMFQLKVADAGIFDGVKAGLRETLELIQSADDAGSELAGTISTVLGTAIMMAVSAAGGLVDIWDVFSLGIAVAIADIGRMKSQALEAFVAMGEGVMFFADAMGATPTMIANAAKNLASQQAMLIASRIEVENTNEELQRQYDLLGRGAAGAREINEAIAEGMAKTGGASDEIERFAGAATKAAGEVEKIAEAVDAIDTAVFDDLGADIEAAFEPLIDKLEDLQAEYEDAVDGLRGLAASALPSGVTDIADAAKQGAVVGGPAGAAVAGTAALLMQSEQFAEVQERLSAMLQQLANAVGSMLIGLDPVIAAVQYFVNVVVGVLEPLFTALGSVLGVLFSPLETLAVMFRTVGDAFAPLRAAVQPLMQLIEPIAKVLLLFMPILTTIRIAMAAVSWAFEKLAPALELVAMVIGAVVDGLSWVWNKILDAVIWLVEGLDAIIPGTQDAMEALADSVRAMQIGVEGEAKASNELTDDMQAQHDAQLALLGSTDETTESMEALNEQLLNIPAGFKIAYARFNAMADVAFSYVTAMGSGGGFSIPAMAAGGIVTTPTLAMIGEGGPEAVIPLSQFGGGSGGGTTINIENLTVQANDPQELLDQLTRVASRRGLVSSGSPVLSAGPRFAT